MRSPDRSTSPIAGQEPENIRSFRTHQAYLAAFRRLATGGTFAGGWDQRLNTLADRSLAAYDGHIRQVRDGRDESTVRRCLNRAWAAETILCTAVELSDGADLLRLALAWGAVQAYYAYYGVAQAVLVAEGKPRSDSHSKTQHQVVGLWAERAFSLEPWSLAAAEAGTRRACASGFLNGPGRPLNLNLHPWAFLAPGEEWDRAAKALHTTREDRIKKAQAQARQKKRRDRDKVWKAEEAARRAGRTARKPPNTLPRLTDEEKVAERSRIRPYTMLDYLYRLRINANYIDNELFSQGPETDSDAQSFATHMEYIVAATMLVHELRLSKLLGSKWVAEEADAWLTRNRATAAAYGLGSRLSILKSA